MKKCVYVETSVASYLTARPTRDVRAAAWQQITSQWWENVRADYDLFLLLSWLLLRHQQGIPKQPHEGLKLYRVSQSYPLMKKCKNLPAI